MRIRKIYPIPSIATINRALKKAGKTKRKAKGTRKRIPSCLKLEASLPNEVHQMDTIGPRYIRGYGAIYCMALAELFRGLYVVKGYLGRSQDQVIDFILWTWRTLGIPKYLSVDNQLSFHGSNRYPRSFGTLIRLSLLAGVIPVFIPKSSPWFNSTVEGLNGLFKRVFWRKVTFSSLEDFGQKAEVFTINLNQKPRKSLSFKVPVDIAPNFKPRLFIPLPSTDLKKLPLTDGEIWFLRKVGEDGMIDIFSEKFEADRSLATEYVKAVISTSEQRLRIYFDYAIVKEHEYKLAEPVLKYYSISARSIETID